MSSVPRRRLRLATGRSLSGRYGAGAALQRRSKEPSIFPTGSAAAPYHSSKAVAQAFQRYALANPCPAAPLLVRDAGGCEQWFDPIRGLIRGRIVDCIAGPRMNLWQVACDNRYAERERLDDR